MDSITVASSLPQKSKMVDKQKKRLLSIKYSDEEEEVDDDEEYNSGEEGDGVEDVLEEERMLEEEEALGVGRDYRSELAELEKEAEMPLEELKALYASRMGGEESEDEDGDEESEGDEEASEDKGEGNDHVEVNRDRVGWVEMAVWGTVS